MCVKMRNLITAFAFEKPSIPRSCYEKYRFQHSSSARAENITFAIKLPISPTEHTIYYFIGVYIFSFMH